MLKTYFVIISLLIWSLVLMGSSSNGSNLPIGEVTKTQVDITDGTDGTYYYYSNMKSYSGIGLYLVLDGGTATVTATVEASIQDDGTAKESLAYIDVTEAVFGTASYTDDCMLLDDTNALGLTTMVRVKIVAASTDDSGDWTIFRKLKQ